MAAKCTADEVEEHLQCAICLDTLSDPRMLACQHTFCFACLEKLPKGRGAGQDAGFKLSCPSCRESHAFQDVKALAKNRLVVQLLDTLQSQSVQSIPVHMCEECDEDKRADGFCQECQMYLCTFCISYHQKSKRFKQHAILALAALGSMQNKSDWSSLLKREPVCERHHGEKMEVFCKQCRRAACIKCTVIEHRRCECISLEEACAKATEGIEKNIQALSAAAIRPLKDAIDKNLAEEEQSTIDAQRAETMLKEDFKQLRLFLNRYEDNLLGQVAGKRQHDKEALQKNVARLRADLHRAQQVESGAMDLIENFCRTTILDRTAATIQDLQETSVGTKVSVALGDWTAQHLRYERSSVPRDLPCCQVYSRPDLQYAEVTRKRDAPAEAIKQHPLLLPVLTEHRKPTRTGRVDVPPDHEYTLSDEDFHSAEQKGFSAEHEAVEADCGDTPGARDIFADPAESDIGAGAFHDGAYLAGAQEHASDGTDFSVLDVPKQKRKKKKKSKKTP